MTFHVLLILASSTILSMWLPERLRYIAVALVLILLLSCGLVVGALEPVALLWLAGLFAAAWWAAKDRAWRAVGWVIVVTLSLGIGFGLLPGFSPVPLAEPAPLKSGSAPYTLQIGLGKPLVAMALLLWLVPVARGVVAWRSIVSATPVVVAMSITALAVPLLAWGVGAIQPAPGLPTPATTLVWITINLLFVCTVEEAFFRGLVQRGLRQVMPPVLAIAAAALLFGLAHFGGGWTYVLLATVAGAGYGLAYHLSGQRVEAAILAHWGVNLVHFLFFTYPTPH